MNSSRIGYLRALAYIGGAAVAVATVAWIVRRAGEGQPSSKPPSASTPLSVSEELDEATPNSFSFEPGEEEPKSITAWPSARPVGISSPDDYDSLSPDDLGAAFLAGATDTSLDEPPSSTAELAGFQIYERDGAPEGELAEDEDAELADIFDRPARPG